MKIEKGSKIAIDGFGELLDDFDSEEPYDFRVKFTESNEIHLIGSLDEKEGARGNKMGKENEGYELEHITVGELIEKIRALPIDTLVYISQVSRIPLVHVAYNKILSNSNKQSYVVLSCGDGE